MRRTEGISLFSDGRFDWLIEEDQWQEGDPAVSRAIERIAGEWLLVGEGSGPHFLQLVADNGDMFSFEAQPGPAGTHLLKGKPWQRSAL